MNAAKTTNEEISFGISFFRDFKYNNKAILRDGYSAEHDSYSFIVSSKLMVMLFRTLDPSKVNYVHFHVDCNEKTPESRRYKLNVEVFTKKQLLKKYLIGYSPAEFVPTDIPERYLELHKKNDVCQFCLEVSVFKQFMDIVPIASEDFGIEAKVNKLTFLAYTKQNIKESDYLKQAMLISVLMAVDELPLSTLGEVIVGINFLLKDFRNYVNLIASFKRDMRLSSGYTDEEPTVDVYFLEPGDPILIRYRDVDITVSLIEITANDGDAKQGSDQSERLLLKPPVIKLINSLSESISLSKSKPHKSLDGPSHPSASVPSMKAIQTELGPDLALSDEEFLDRVTYGGYDSTTHGKKRHFDTISEDDNPFCQIEEEAEFGPTQGHRKPDSLFD